MSSRILHSIRRVAPTAAYAVLPRTSTQLSTRLVMPCCHQINATRSMVMITKTSVRDVPDDDVKIPVNPSPDSTSTLSTNKYAIETAELSITTACINRIQSLTKGNDEYLRVYVDAGGCSGFQYKFELTDEAMEVDDVVYEDNGARVVVDQDSLDLLKGSTIDFVQEMIRSSFAVVDNPQSESACGCGSSFAVKNFESNPALD